MTFSHIVNYVRRFGRRSDRDPPTVLSPLRSAREGISRWWTRGANSASR
jgi:hypothetical protein